MLYYFFIGNSRNLSWGFVLLALGGLWRNLGLFYRSKSLKKIFLNECLLLGSFEGWNYYLIFLWNSNFYFLSMLIFLNEGMGFLQQVQNFTIASLMGLLFCFLYPNLCFIFFLFCLYLSLKLNSCIWYPRRIFSSCEGHIPFFIRTNSFIWLLIRA